MRSRGLQAAGIDAERARPKGRDLEKTADDRDVLEKVDHLVLVGEVVVKRERGHQREGGHDQADEARPIAEEQKDTAAELHHDRDQIAEQWEWETDSAYVAL